MRDPESAALRYASGRYVADRASQLSGVPRSTLYDWRRCDIYIPDFDAASPVAWSYRDLVFLRLLAWLRQGGMPRPIAAKEVRQVKDLASDGVPLRYLGADTARLLVAPEQVDEVPSLLPFTNIGELFKRFDLLRPIAELSPHRERRLWAPDLRRPSERTTISPSVVAGEPCVDRTRIPTASLYALHVERALPSSAIVELYPGLQPESVDDAIMLERRLRGHDLPELQAA